ncbi:1,6-anhydro-N-acetylmuramyl-L-alanine amidase AmpD [Azoarcus sp. Aa7]|nr:1,6-anhydro-N-acetylmuramyl-L-alanine amidase AmpD [Azoarcus sp. Aa7]
MRKPTADLAPREPVADALGRLDAGWLEGAQRCPSPNFDARPVDTEVKLIVVHAISLPPDEFGGPGVEQLFTNTLDPAAHPYYAAINHLRVSAHFFIRRDGSLLQFVPTDARAWHAGISCWRERERCNDFSIGIELEGCDTQPFAPVQYTRLAALLRVLCAAYPVEAITGHSDIAPGRKTDPGPCFDWTCLRPALGLPNVACGPAPATV